jgi:hypothetical protein
MTEKMAIRTFPTAFKLKAIKRAEGGEGVLPAARKLESFVQMKFEGGAEPDFKFPRASAYPGQ